MNNEQSLDLLNQINQPFSFSDQAIARVDCYCKHLIHWNQKINLVGHQSIKALINQSILDCFLVADYFLKKKLFNQKKALDFGSGAGLPGVVLKIIADDSSDNLTNQFDIDLVERRQKKSAFLNYINLAMDLNIKTHAVSIETLPMIGFDWIITRATHTSSQQTVDLVKKQLKENGKIFLMKSEPENNQSNFQYLENIELSKTNYFKRYLIEIIP